ncbi:MAG: hypothetical protein ACU843_05855 [Gammaproteobacteria bacterium]
MKWRSRPQESPLAAASITSLSAPRLLTGGATGSPATSPDPSFRPYVLFRSTAQGASYGHVAMAYLDAPDDQRYVSPLSCERVYFASGRGICLKADRGVVTTYRAEIFDTEFRILHGLPLVGVPSRARLSPDGRFAAMTVFTTGHSYAGSEFSTRTSLIDTDSGEFVIENLEELAVVKEGVPFRGTDFNYWGVTFARDPVHFYATLASSGRFYLIEGNLKTRQAEIIHENVECPSISPDNSRIAFKRRAGVGDRFARFAWQIFILNLATREEMRLAGETRSVDDQIEWLDHETIIYGLPDEVSFATAATNTWALSTNPSSKPRQLMALAFSPAVVRQEAVRE